MCLLTLPCSSVCMQKTVKPLLTDLYGENHGSNKPIRQMSEGNGNVVIDMKK
jgi:hypothetical protein